MGTGRWELELHFPACNAPYHCLGKTGQKFSSPFLKLLLFSGEKRTSPSTPSQPYMHTGFHRHQTQLLAHQIFRGQELVHQPRLSSTPNPPSTVHHAIAPSPCTPRLPQESPKPCPITEHSALSAVYPPTLTNLFPKHRSNTDTKTHALPSSVTATLQVCRKTCSNYSSVPGE